MSKQINLITAKAETIFAKLGFKDAEINKVTTDRVVAKVNAKFPRVRKALSRQYGIAEHNIVIGKGRNAGRRATWILDAKGTIVCKGSIKGPITVSFATLPFIK
jgi:hypothetical protein